MIYIGLIIIILLSNCNKIFKFCDIYHMLQWFTYPELWLVLFSPYIYNDKLLLIFNIFIISSGGGFH